MPESRSVPNLATQVILDDPDAAMTYAGFAPCGCIDAVVVDRQAWAKDTARNVADWIKEGMEVRRITVGEARAAMAAREPAWGKCLHRLGGQQALDV